MSFSVSLNTFPHTPELPDASLPKLPDHTVKPLPQPTSTQEMHQMEGAGENTAQIAANLGLPVNTVNSTLGYSISTDPQVSSAQTSILIAGAAALTPPLDVKA